MEGFLGRLGNSICFKATIMHLSGKSRYGTMTGMAKEEENTAGVLLM